MSKTDKGQTMRTVKERALFERAKRDFKKDGVILHKHKQGKRDYLMNGNLYAYTVDPSDRIVVSYWDYSGFISMCGEASILKADE